MAVVHEKRKPAGIIGRVPVDKSTSSPTSFANQWSLAMTTEPSMAVVYRNNNMAGLNKSSLLSEPTIQRQVKPSGSCLPSDMSHLIDVELLQCDRIACLEDPGSMGDGLLIYMMVMEDAR